MDDPINILHVEDNLVDAELIRARLALDHLDCTITRVTTEVEFTRELENRKYDLVLSDFTLPAFDGQLALRIAHRLRPDLPFIYASGTIGESRATEALTRGASAWVVKDRLVLLSATVQRVLALQGQRRLRARAEYALHRPESFQAVSCQGQTLAFLKGRDGKYHPVE